MSNGSAQPPDEPREPVPFVDFDPYRFGAPEHPIAPEYAVPGYVPPQPPTFGPPPVAPPLPPHLAANPGQPMPPYQQPYQQPYGYQYPPRPPVATGAPGKAQAALWLGVASVGLFWLSVLDVIPIVLAVIFGFIGMGEARVRPNRAGYNQAIAGIALAAVGAVAALVFSVWVFHKVEPCMDYDVGSSAFQDCVNEHI